MKIFLPLILLAFLSGCSQTSSPTMNTPNSWTTASSIGFTARAGLASSVVNAKIYTTGGYYFPNNDPSLPAIYLNTLEVYDPAANSWSTPQTSGSCKAKAYPISEVVNGKIYLIGGIGDSGIINTVQVFDPLTNNWSAPVTKGKFNWSESLTSCVAGGKIYTTSLFYPDSLDIQVYDPSSNTWSFFVTNESFIPQRYLCWNAINDKIYLVGDTMAYVFDPVTNAWNTHATIGKPSGHVYSTSSVVGGKIYVVGGSANNGNLQITVDVYDPSTNSWSTPATTGVFTPREYLTSSSVGGKIYVMGGVRDNDALNTNEFFTPKP